MLELVKDFSKNTGCKAIAFLHTIGDEQLK